jgi:hypothetical protein
VIRAFVKPNGQTGYSLELENVEELFRDTSLLEGGGMIVVRLDDDATMFKITDVCAAAKQKVQRAVSLIVGSLQHFWSVVAQYPDGQGWRLILASAVMQSQAQDPRP